MPPENPYDFSGYLSDQLDASSGLVHGYTGQLDSFRSQLDELNTYAETGYTPVLGGTLLGAIGAALAGGSMAQIAGAGYGAGGAAYNNLEKIEAEKRKDLIQQIADTESQLKDQINFSQQLVGAQAGYNKDMALSYQRGEIPSLDPNSPYGIEQKDLYDRTIAGYAANPAYNTVSPQTLNLLNKTTGEDYGPGTNLREAGLGYELGAEARRQQNQALAGEKWRAQLAQRRVAGLKEINPGSATAPMVKRASEISSAYDNIKSAYEDLAELYNENGETIFTGPESAAVTQRVARITAAFRDLYQTGQNLTGREPAMLFSNAPADFDIQGWTKVIEQKLRGQGPVGFIEEANKNLDSLYTSSLLALNQVDPSLAGVYTASQYKKYNLADVFARQETEVGRMSSAPLTTPGAGSSSKQDKINQLKAAIAELKGSP